MADAGQHAAAPVHAALRAATRAAHHALDHHPLLAGLLEPGIDRAGYGRSLAALHGAFSAAEAVLRTGAVPSGDYLPRVPRLEADLAALGCRPLPFVGGIGAGEGAAARIGLRYVLEGSALGGQFIATHLRRVLGEECPCAFFGGDGPEACNARWRAFLVQADRACPGPDFTEAANAAVAVFEAFRRHLDRCV